MAAGAGVGVITGVIIKDAIVVGFRKDLARGLVGAWKF
jgi:hypothetical protein